MKLYKYFRVIAMSLAVIGFFTACEDEAVHDFEGEPLAHFPEVANTYFVFEAEDPGFDVQVGVTEPVDTDRTYTIVVDESESTAVEGEDFTLSSKTVTIPAGSVIGNVKINGDFQNLTEPKAIVLQLQDGQDNAVFNQTYAIGIQQFCPYVQDNFVGIWEYTSEMFGGTFEVEIVAGATPNEIIVKEPIEDGKDMIIVLDDSNPANFTASVAKQVVWTSATYGPASFAGGGTFSACNNEIDMNLELTVAAGSFGTAREFFKKVQ